MSLPASTVKSDQVVLRHPDPAHDLDGVCLWTDLAIPLDREFTRVDGGWELRQPIPPVGRLEYLFELAEGGAERLQTDDPNPLRVAGAFGDHSWLPMPGYREPDWLTATGVAGEHRELGIPTALGQLTGRLWLPDSASDTDALPLLISHDGPEMDSYGHLTQYVAAGIAAGAFPPMRVALLAPGPRNQWYSAEPGYGTALVEEVLPALAAVAPTSGRPVLIGQSLGALAALQAAWTHRDAFGGLLLQSGSYFTSPTDPQESGFETWQQITAFTAELHAAGPQEAPLPPTAIVCGTAEENLANNRLMFATLERLGMPVIWGEIGDGHTWTCWRDLLDPYLTRVLQAALG